MRIQYLILLLLILCSDLLAQEEASARKELPAFKMTRAAEQYAFLKDKDEESYPYKQGKFDAIKYIPFSQSGNSFLSMGGQFRTRYEHFSNRFWIAEANQNFYSQRIAFHANVVLGKHMRLFGELYHGYVSHEEAFAEYDEVDVFQAFAEINFSKKKNQKILLLLGRQEMGLGATRLIGIREGPNIRRSYDMARIIFSKAKSKFQIFYGKEVLPFAGAFDNRMALFDADAPNPYLWGFYSQFPIKGLNGVNEFYYLGFKVNNASFSDVSGEERRHTIGLRRFGKIGEHWKYNSEITYQFGEIGSDDISAFSINTDWHYELRSTNWNWSPGLKLEYVSGDRNTNDGKINAFNPMFVNPAYYSLAATITPTNLIGIHPSLSAKPTKNLKLYMEWAMFWRASKDDALYRPTRFINRPANGIEDKSIGHQFGAKVQYEISRHFNFDFDISYFVAGRFLEESGASDNIFHVAPTLNFRF